MEICPNLSEVAGFYLRKWLSASCNRWVIHFKTSVVLFDRLFRYCITFCIFGCSFLEPHDSGWVVSVFLIVLFCVSLLKACALQFLHERNISHLDLKPQNILLCGSVLKLAGDHMSTLTKMISGDSVSELCFNRIEPLSFCCRHTDLFRVY